MPTGVEWIACDALLMSGGWTPSAHLFSQSRGKLAFDEARQMFVPGAPAQRQRSAGACNGKFALREVLIEGADAGAAAAVDAGFPVQTPPLNYSVDKADDAFGGWLGDASAPGFEHAQAFVDFQNDVCAKDIRLAVQEGMRSIEHVKRYTTTGMATDQGKTSNMNALAIAAKALDKPIPAVGLTTFRQPYTPVTFGAFAGAARGDLFDPIRRTAIHGWAEENGAVFEDVGLWKRAWYFPHGGEDMHAAVERECEGTRAGVGMFDASTLGKIEVVGPDAAAFLERLYTNPFAKLEPGRCRYGLMLNEHGFIMDDGVIARIAADRFHVTTTTGGAARVLHQMEDYLQTEFPELKVWLTSTTEQWAVIAVQGPQRARPDRAVRRRHRSLRRGDAAYERARGQDLRRADAADARQLHRRTRLRDQRRARRRARRSGRRCGRRAGAWRGRLRHRGDARDARREGLHHRRPGHRRHRDARRCRPRLGDRQDEEGFRRQALAEPARHDRRTTASSSSACSPTTPDYRAGGGRADRRHRRSAAGRACASAT